MVKRKNAKLDRGLQLAIAAAGTRYRLAKMLGLTPSAVLRWKRVPTERLLKVEKVTGIDRAKLRSELFDRGR